MKLYFVLQQKDILKINTCVFCRCIRGLDYYANTGAVIFSVGLRRYKPSPTKKRKYFIPLTTMMMMVTVVMVAMVIMIMIMSVDDNKDEDHGDNDDDDEVEEKLQPAAKLLLVVRVIAGSSNPSFNRPRWSQPPG